MQNTVKIASKDEEPGRKLRRVRERLGLRYREVEEATQAIAEARGNQDFAVGLSRLADIENRGTLPSIYRIYSLCAVYSLSVRTVLGWYGVDLALLPADVARVSHRDTRLIDREQDVPEALDLPQLNDPSVFTRTSYLSRHVKEWGRLPIALLKDGDIRQRRYAFLGTEAWGMYPLLRPGSFVQIDERKRKPDDGPWVNEADRPIYFVEHRKGYLCAWCTLKGKYLTVQYHPNSGEPPHTYETPGEAEVVGQVIGVAMRLEPGRRRHKHS